jgi:hypothetical protein
VAHLARQQLAGLLRLLAFRAVEEDAEHGAADDALVGPAPAGRDPPDAVVAPDAEVDLVGARRRPGGGERGPYGVEVGRGDAG